MNSGLKNHIVDIIKNIISEDSIRITSAYFFFKHYNNFSFNKDEVMEIKEKLDEDCYMSFHKFEYGFIQGPYEPFLDFIRSFYNENYKNIGVEEFVERAGVYKPVSGLFASYIKGDEPKRNEDPIGAEIEFEKKKIIEGILNCLNYISKNHKIIFVLDSLQYAHISTLELIIDILNENSNSFIMVVTYNETDDVYSYVKDRWEELKQVSAKYERTFEFDKFMINSGSGEKSSYKAYKEYNEKYVSHEEEYQKLILTKIRENYLFLCLEQAEYFIRKINITIRDNIMDISEDGLLKLYFYGALIYSYMNNPRNAYLYCEKMKDLDCVKNNPENKYYYYYGTILYNIQCIQSSYTKEIFEKAYKIAAEEKRIDLEMLEIIGIINLNTNNLTHVSDYNIPEKLLDDADKYNKLNHLAYAYLMGYFYRDNMAYFQRGMEIAKQIGNIQLEIKAWQRNAAYASFLEKFDDTLYFYNKSLELMKRDKRHKEEAEIYNGLGYNCILKEKFSLALNYFQKSISIGIQIEDSESILDALYNMSVIGILTDGYLNTVKCADGALRIMDGLGLERLKICNKSKIYGLLIFAYIKLDQLYNARLYYENMESMLGHILNSPEPNYFMWEDDLFLYYVVTAMMARINGEKDKLIDNIKKANELLEDRESKQIYIYPKVKEFEAEAYKELGMDEERRRCLEAAIEFCGENGMKAAESKLKNMLDDKSLEIRKSDNVRFDYSLTEEIKNVVDKLYLQTEVKRKSKMLEFFENWVETLNSGGNNTEILLDNSLNLLGNTFDVDCVMYINAEKKIPKLMYVSTGTRPGNEDIEGIYRYFCFNPSNICISRFSRNYPMYAELIEKLGQKDVSSMVAIPFAERLNVTDVFIALRFKKANYTENIEPFREEEVDILKTALRELIETINRNKIKKKLEKTSVTDNLTGVYNRQGMVIKLNQIIEENRKGKIPQELYTVLYIDLDNFKFCNDNFGHDAGDVVLVSFSGLLNDIIEDKGYVIRYGGDEFLVIIPGENEMYGEVIAGEIFKRLAKEKGFVDQIERVFNSDIDIDENSRITCSIGIASGIVSDYEDISLILKRADQALHDIKVGSKHDYKIWSND